MWMVHVDKGSHLDWFGVVSEEGVVPQIDEVVLLPIGPQRVDLLPENAVVNGHRLLEVVGESQWRR